MKKEELIIGREVFFIRYDAIQSGIVTEKLSKEITINRDDVMIKNMEPNIKSMFECQIMFNYKNEIRIYSLYENDLEKLFESKQDLIKSL